MGYCTRCGDLNTATRCKRCNGPVMARTLHRAGEGTTTENVDRWKSRYLDNDGSALFRAPSVLSTANKSAVKNVNYLKQLQRSTSNVVRPLVTQTKSFISLVPVPSSWVDTKGGDMCTKCDQEIADQGVALASGASYHKECLQCQKCDQVLDNPSFMSANNKFYHNECVTAEGNSLDCRKCTQPITNTYINVHTNKYHVECFSCTACNHHLAPSSMYKEMAKFAYCKGCADTKFAGEDATLTTKVVPQPLSIIPMVVSKSEDKDVKPSTLFSSRSKPLPKFGMTKLCPGCDKVVGIMEEKNGPMATKWHKQCLKCEGCSKALDSGAMMKDSGNLTSLICRACHLKSRNDAVGKRNNPLTTCSV